MTSKTSPKRMLATVFTTTFLASAIIIGLIYLFKPQSPTEDLSNFIHNIPGIKLLADKTTSSSAWLSKTNSSKTVSKEDLKKSSQELDNLNIDNFDATIGQNDQ